MLRSASAMTAAVLTGFALTAAANPIPPGDTFRIRTTQKSLEAVAGAIKAYAETNRWLHLAEYELRGGPVTVVKICCPAIAADIFADGPHVAAMLTCGNSAICVEQGRTTVSMLHPKFMSTLVPHEHMDKAVHEVSPLFEKMLDTIWN